MSLSIGIVGLPNVGKSTLFNLLTQNQVEASNYPFCTIDPHVGCVKVPDERLQQLATISKTGANDVIPTTVEFVDIAGLVKGASKGEGLGNKFLANIREVDAICHVVRKFKDDNIIHVSGEVNPSDDKEVIELELIMADLESLDKQLSNLERQAKGKAPKELLDQIETVKKIKQTLEDGKFANTVEISEDQQSFVKQLNLLTTKPVMFLVNVDEGDMDAEIELPHVEKENICKINVKLESEIMELAPEEREEYLKELGLKESGLDKFIRHAYGLLDLITFFTTGEKETRAWTVQKGAKAPQAAGVIHTDFEKGFIRAEVISYSDFIDCNGESGAREKGKLRVEGKEYLMADGDVCHFLFN